MLLTTPLLAVLAAGAQASGLAIVIDAGSTGTRVYEINFPGGCAAPTVETLAKGGPLASTEDQTLGDILAGAAARRPEVQSADIRVIGTGGFRRLDGGSALVCGEACEIKRKRVLEATRARLPGAKVHVHVATGEEEGKLSRRSVAMVTGDARAATVEIGGATVQVAYVADDDSVKSRSAKIGVTEVLKSVSACALPATCSKCREAMSAYLGSDPDAAALLASPVSGGTVVGVGGAFASLARMMPMEGAVFGHLGEVDAFGAKTCRDGAGFDAKYKAQACAQTALESILIERFKIAKLEDVSLEIGAALEADDDLGPATATSCPLP